jgi:hypothetical protein
VCSPAKLARQSKNGTGSGQPVEDPLRQVVLLHSRFHALAAPVHRAAHHPLASVVAVLDQRPRNKADGHRLTPVVGEIPCAAERLASLLLDRHRKHLGLSGIEVPPRQIIGERATFRSLGLLIEATVEQ